MNNKEEFIKKILRWHKKNKRDFSWRRTRNPYKIMVAEVMLQKTSSKNVSGVYDGFIAKYPSAKMLSKAQLDELSEEMAPLGIYSRAERLKNLAADIVKKRGGRVPPDKKMLLELPGVGNYIANAVLCFAFNRDVPLVDTNVIRILDRVFSVGSSKSYPGADKDLWDAAEEIVPRGAARRFNYALLDFAAKVCTARNSKHGECPVRSLCDYYRAVS